MFTTWMIETLKSMATPYWTVGLLAVWLTYAILEKNGDKEADRKRGLVLVLSLFLPSAYAILKGSWGTMVIVLTFVMLGIGALGGLIYKKWPDVRVPLIAACVLLMCGSFFGRPDATKIIMSHFKSEEIGVEVNKTEKRSPVVIDNKNKPAQARTKQQH